MFENPHNVVMMHISPNKPITVTTEDGTVYTINEETLKFEPPIPQDVLVQVNNIIGRIK